MSKFRSKVNLRLRDGRKVSPSTGIFEVSDTEAADLLENGWVVPANAPLISGVAEETIQKQADEIKDLKKQLGEKDKQILNLQNILNKKEADIDRLNKAVAGQAAQSGGKSK